MTSRESTSFAWKRCFAPGSRDDSRETTLSRKRPVRPAGTGRSTRSIVAADCRPTSMSCSTENRLNPDGERRMACAPSVGAGANTTAPASSTPDAFRSDDAVDCLTRVSVGMGTRTR